MKSVTGFLIFYYWVCMGEWSCHVMNMEFVGPLWNQAVPCVFIQCLGVELRLGKLLYPGSHLTRPLSFSNI